MRLLGMTPPSPRGFATLKRPQTVAVEQIEADQAYLIELSRKIHAHPELAYEEVEAAALLASSLASRGFAVETGIAGIATAFDARFCGMGPGPTIALLAEYDALPEVGHGCAHNLIGAGIVGAALGIARVMPKLAGTLRVIGTPAEEFTEGKPGKIRLLEEGVFSGIDACLLFHPKPMTAIALAECGCTVLDIAFRGRAAHAAADPWNGLNALDAVVLTYNGLSMMRQQLKVECRLHAIITKGGDTVNIIPSSTALRIMVRSPEACDLQDLATKVEDCARGSALATGTEVGVRVVCCLQPPRFNHVLSQVVSRNLTALGESPQQIELNNASSDFGNVSQTLPALSVLIRTHPAGIIWHSREAAHSAITEDAHSGMILAAKALAMSVIDLLMTPQLVEEARAEFSEAQDMGRQGQPKD